MVSLRPTHIHLAFPCPHRQAFTHPAPCFHLPDPLGPRSQPALQVHPHLPKDHRKGWFPITPTPLHRHTRRHHREKALLCKRKHNHSSLITSTTHLPGILLIGHHTTRGLAIRLRRRPALLRRPSVPARWHPASNRRSKRGKRARRVWRHKHAIHCACGIFFFFAFRSSSMP